MTNLRKSDAQLDAEAQPLEDRDLEQAILLHRILYKTEIGILRLHAREGETAAEFGPNEPRPKPKTNGWPRDLKQPFSHSFQAFLDEQYGSFPWSKAMLYLRWTVCRPNHYGHTERPEWRGSLCYALVNLVIRHETSLDYARLQLGLPDEGKSRRTLDSALLVIERRLEALLQDDRAKQALPARTPAEWMAAAYRHQPLGGAHALECENPVCRARRAA